VTVNFKSIKSNFKLHVLMFAVCFSAGTCSEYSDAGRHLVRSILRYRIRDEGASNCSSPITTDSRRVGGGCGRVHANAGLSSSDH